MARVELHQSSSEKLVIPNAIRDAMEPELDGSVSRFINRAEKYRDWNPHELPLQEMQQLGDLLTDRTTTIIEGFMGIEAFIDDYDTEGQKAFAHSPARAKMHARWIKEEGNHPLALKLILLHSGKRTQQELDTYEETRSNRTWRHEYHAGMDDEITATAFGGLQERKTYIDYRALRGLVRNDYGLPNQPTQEEISRGYEFGASEGITRVSRDELSHHVEFVELARIYRKYFTEYFDARVKVITESFKMPDPRLLPNALNYLRAIRGTDISNKDVYVASVLNPFLNAVGVSQSFQI